MSYFRAINFLDENGDPYGIKYIDNRPLMIADDYLHQIALGNISGKAPLFKFGYNADVGTSDETIWTEGGLYDWVSVDAAAGIVKVSSTSTNDAVAGTGALTCAIYGLDLSGDPQSESIILTGQTAVNSANSYSRVNRIICNTAGTTLANEGIVYVGTGTITSGVPAVKWAAVPIGENQTLQTIWTVPNGKTLLINSITVTTNSNKGNTAKLYFRPSGELFQIKDISELFSTAFHQPFEVPLVLAAGTDLEVRAKGVTGGAEIAAKINGWYE